MEVAILGPLDVRSGGRPVDVGGPRLRVLLARLALDPGRPVSVDALSEALWGADPPADQANALQSLVSRLRRLLPGDVLVSGPGTYRLDLPAESVDAVRFERQVRDGQEALKNGDPAGAARCLREALGLWRGPALAELPGVAHAAWLEELRLTAHEDCAEAELALGRAADLVPELRQLAAEQPMRERLTGLLIRALHGAGRQSEALGAYEGIRRRLADEYGVDPSPELRAVHLAVLRDDPPPAPKSNLRTPLTSFVGREDEVRQLAVLLGQTRLLTLLGPGGAGKTRLATAAAETVSSGVWLAELAPVTDPDAVPTAVLHALALPRTADPAQPQRDPLARIAAAIGSTPTLIVLDNCEHVLDASARLAADLLSRCPSLRILATTREPLGVLGESLFPVAPLGLPAAGLGAAEALAYPSVQLLRDRAAAVSLGFAVDESNVADVIEICRRLDGLPLAIELAAARLRTLSPSQVAARLDDRFRLLTGGNRTALPRHRTLRAVVDWSWDLLTEDERDAAERLAVFPGTITAESAAGVWGAEADELIDALADKSLLQPVAEGRYRMLETIREYGLERLAGGGRIDEVRRAHAAYFLSLAERAEPHLRGGGQLPWIALLRAERDNLLGALAFAADAGDADSAIRMAAALSLYWNFSGDHAEAAAWLGRALAVPGEAPLGARTVVTALHMINAALNGDFKVDDAPVARLRELTEQSDVLGGHPFLPIIEPVLLMLADDGPAALAVVDRNLAHPDPWARAMLLSIRGQVQENDGDAVGRRSSLEASVAAFREVGERWGLSVALSSLADVLGSAGDVPGAVAALQEAVRLIEELDNKMYSAFQRVWIANLRAVEGDVERATSELRAYLTIPATPYNAREGAYALTVLGDIARRCGEYDEAAEHFAAARERASMIPLTVPQFDALLSVSEGMLAIARGDVAAARGLVAEALLLSWGAKDMPVLARVTVASAALAHADGDPLHAATLLGVADGLRGGPDHVNVDGRLLAERLRAELGGDRFAEAFESARNLPRDGQFALAVPESVRSGAAAVGPHGERREDGDHTG